MCVIPLTILDPMHFCNSSFVLGTHSQNLLEYFEHHSLSSLHTSTMEDSLSVYDLEDDIFYSHESTDKLICDFLDYLDVR